MKVKPNDIATLVELFAASDWDELHVEIDGLQLFLSTDPNARLAHSATPVATPVERVPLQSRSNSGEVAADHGAAAPVKKEAGVPAQSSVPSHSIPAHWVAVTAPNLGTFYRAPKPGAAPYVEEGQSVEATTELCLLEVMKLFTAVKAGVAGVVRRVCVEDGAMVEFGQALFYIERN